MSTTYQRLFGDCLVQADSVEDFAARYRRHDRFGALPDQQQAQILRVHRQEIEVHGITWIAHYDSNTGHLVAWMPAMASTSASAAITPEEEP